MAKQNIYDNEAFFENFKQIKAGFLIEECQESHASDELREQYPDIFGGTLHRPDFIFFKCKKSPLCTV